jgi:hypothetical protein
VGSLETYVSKRAGQLVTGVLVGSTVSPESVAFGLSVVFGFKQLCRSTMRGKDATGTDVLRACSPHVKKRQNVLPYQLSDRASRPYWRPT